MSAAELSSLDPQYYPVPVVKPRLENEAVHLDTVGEPEWISTEAILSNYGGAPDQLRTFIVPSDRMAPTIRADERVRGVLLNAADSPETLSNGAIYLIRSTTRIFPTRPYKRQQNSNTADHSPAGDDARQDEPPLPAPEGDRDNDILLSFDNPEVPDESISLEKWADRIRVIGQLLEVKRML